MLSAPLTKLWPQKVKNAKDEMQQNKIQGGDNNLFKLLVNFSGLSEEQKKVEFLKNSERIPKPSGSSDGIFFI